MKLSTYCSAHETLRCEEPECQKEAKEIERETRASWVYGQMGFRHPGITIEEVKRYLDEREERDG